MNEKSQWIWVDAAKTDDMYGEFYSEVQYTGGDVTMCISADSNYTLFVNGVFVDSDQYPDYPQFKVYDTLDITKYCHVGVNRVAIIVWYYGVSNFSYYPGNPALRFTVSCQGELIGYSDENTLSRLSVAYQNHYKKSITPQLGFSFLYDATKEDNWKLGQLNGFQKSVQVKQQLPLHERPIKKLRICNAVDSKVVRQEGNRVLFDLHREEVGYFTMRIVSPVSQKLIVSYGEHIADGWVRREINGRDFSVEVVVGTGVTEYTNYFRRLGLRYLEIWSEAPVEIEKLSVLPCEYPLTMVEKDWGDPLRNQIYETSLRTLHLCMHTHYEDCPWREQALYGMDSRNQMLCGYYGFREFIFPRACLNLFAQDDREDGLLSICIPTKTDLTIPSFSLHYILAVREYTAISGDLTLVREILPKLRSVIAVFLARHKDGLYMNFQEKQYWRFYEWTDGLSGGEFIPGSAYLEVDAAHNCLLSLALQAMQDICDRLGVEAEYGARAAKLNEKIYAVFYDPQRALVRTCLEEVHYSELVNAWAILCGAVTGKEAEKIAERLVDGFDVACSLSMECFKYDALLHVDKDRYAAFVLSDLDRVYGKMLSAGATSFWETHEGQSAFQNAGSLCHGWSAMPVYYYHHLLQ